MSTAVRTYFSGICWICLDLRSGRRVRYIDDGFNLDLTYITDKSHLSTFADL